MAPRPGKQPRPPEHARAVRKARRRAELGDRARRRPAGLAHRVLGHRAGVPRRAAHRERRWFRPRVPAPRVQRGPYGCADREPAREPVLAHWARGVPRREDEQVPRQPRTRLLARRLRRRRAGDPARCVLPALPRRLGVDGRSPRRSAAASGKLERLGLPRTLSGNHRHPRWAARRTHARPRHADRRRRCRRPSGTRVRSGRRGSRRDPRTPRHPPLNLAPSRPPRCGFLRHAHLPMPVAGRTRLTIPTDTPEFRATGLVWNGSSWVSGTTTTLGSGVTASWTRGSNNTDSGFEPQSCMTTTAWPCVSWGEPGGTYATIQARFDANVPSNLVSATTNIVIPAWNPASPKNPLIQVCSSCSEQVLVKMVDLGSGGPYASTPGDYVLNGSGTIGTFSHQIVQLNTWPPLTRSCSSEGSCPKSVACAGTVCIRDGAGRPRWRGVVPGVDVAQGARRSATQQLLRRGQEGRAQGHPRRHAGGRRRLQPAHEREGAAALFGRAAPLHFQPLGAAGRLGQPERLPDLHAHRDQERRQEAAGDRPRAASASRPGWPWRLWWQ